MGERFGGREDGGWSVADAAGALGIEGQRLAAVESGELPDFRDVVLLCRLYDLDMEVLRHRVLGPDAADGTPIAMRGDLAERTSASGKSQRERLR